MIQIFKTGVLPENPHVCFIEAIKDQIPDGRVEKITYEIRSEYVPTTTIKKICIQNTIFIKVRHSRTSSTKNITCYGSEDAESKADMCCIEKHHFKFIEIQI